MNERLSEKTAFFLFMILERKINGIKTKEFLEHYFKIVEMEKIKWILGTDKSVSGIAGFSRPAKVQTDFLGLCFMY